MNICSIVFISFLAVFITSSCAGLNKTLATIAPKLPEAKLMVTPNVADVEVDFKTKVKGKSKRTRTLLEAKDQAYYDAVANNNIDVLVDPVYWVSTKGNKSRAMVTGFAGHYKNIRTETQELVTVADAMMKVAQLTYEQGLKDAQMAFDAKIDELNKKMVAIEKLGNLSVIAKEDLKTYIIGCNGNGNGNGSNCVAEKVLSTNTGIVDKFNALCGGGPAIGASDSKAQVKEKGDGEPTAQDKDDKSDKKGKLMKMFKGKK